MITNINHHMRRYAECLKGGDETGQKAYLGIRYRKGEIGSFNRSISMLDNPSEPESRLTRV